MRPTWTLPLAVGVAWTAALPVEAQDDASLIASAEAAAPAAVSANAAIYAPEADGSMRTLREGTNGWWCVPDSPSTPGPDPICGDANAMEWVAAWIGRSDPPAGKVGIMYMLAGGTDASNTDPYATEPSEGNDWITTGRHVMVVNALDMMAGYPDAAEPDLSQPFVMWAGTPYAHLMLPVE